MVYPHNAQDEKSQRRSRKPKKRYNSGSSSAHGHKSKYRPKQHKVPEKKEVEIPDAFVTYFQLKHPKTWKAFVAHATTPKKFGKGLARLFEILAKGDKQDRKVFGLVPMSLMEEWKIKIELDTPSGKDPPSSGEGVVILGSKEFPWSNLIHDAKLGEFFNTDPVPEEMREYVKEHPVVKTALELFGGEVIGYKDESELQE